MQNFKSTHNLAFEQCEWEASTAHDDYHRFKIGTIHGLCRVKNGCYEILNIENKKRNNGHLDDFFEWFEALCKLTGNALYFPLFTNERFKEFLLRDMGFVKFEDGVIKYYKNGLR